MSRRRGPRITEPGASGATPAKEDSNVRTSLIGTVFVVAAWLAAPSASIADGDDVRALTEESRKAADALLGQVRGELVKALESSGPLRAIVACKYGVPEMSSFMSRKTGWRVSRVSLKPRNPALGAPDAWEQRVLVSFEQRQARGEKGDAMEFGEVVHEPAGRFFRYMKALPLAPLCMNCHGPAESLSEAVRAQLSIEYPHDRAVGHQIGQIRGGVTVKRPLD